MNNIVIVATNNQHKLVEIQTIINEILPSVEVKTLNDVNYTNEIEEYGTSFYQNALIKLEVLSNLYPDAIVIADDSGLEVEALFGAPGVYSARYAMEQEDYQIDKDLANNNKLLQELANKENRNANFKTVLAVKFPNSEPIFVSGSVKGSILLEPRGSNGFGYDPLFTHDGEKSFAQLSSEQKNGLSHRANALKKMAKLKNWQEL